MATKVALLPKFASPFVATPCNSQHRATLSETCPKGIPGRTKNQDSHTRPCPSRMLSWYNTYCLVVFPILKSISPWEGFSHILWKIKKCANHQPVQHACDKKWIQCVLMQLTHDEESLPSDSLVVQNSTHPLEKKPFPRFFLGGS